MHAKWTDNFQRGNILLPSKFRPLFTVLAVLLDVNLPTANDWPMRRTQEIRHGRKTNDLKQASDKPNIWNPPQVSKVMRFAFKKCVVAQRLHMFEHHKRWDFKNHTSNMASTRETQRELFVSRIHDKYTFRLGTYIIGALSLPEEDYSEQNAQWHRFTQLNVWIHFWESRCPIKRALSCWHTWTNLNHSYHSYNKIR